MASETGIEWTDVTCPCYNAKHGTNEARRIEDSGQEGRRVCGGIRGAGSGWGKVVHALQVVASIVRVRPRFVTLGRLGGGMLGVQAGERSAVLSEKAATGERPQFYPCKIWRRTAGSEADQLFCRGWADSASEHVALCRLRARLAYEWGAS